MSLKIYVQRDHQNVTLFENRIFVDVIKGSWDEIILDLEQTINLMTSVLGRRERGSETKERRPCKGLELCCYENSKNCKRQDKEGFSPEEWWLCQHLNFGLWPQLWGEQSYIILSHPEFAVLCYSSLWN